MTAMIEAGVTDFDGVVRAPILPASTPGSVRTTHRGRVDAELARRFAAAGVILYAVERFKGNGPQSYRCSFLGVAEKLPQRGGGWGDQALLHLDYTSVELLDRWTAHEGVLRYCIWHARQTRYYSCLGARERSNELEAAMKDYGLQAARLALWDMGFDDLGEVGHTTDIEQRDRFQVALARLRRAADRRREYEEAVLDANGPQIKPDVLALDKHSRPAHPDYNQYQACYNTWRNNY